MKNHITLKITNSSTFIIGSLSKEDYRIIKRSLSYLPENAIFMMKHVEEQNNNKWEWDGYISTVCYNKHHCRCSIKQDGMHFPTGLIGKVIVVLKKLQIPFNCTDVREKVFASLKLSISDNFEFRDYQTDIVEKAIKQQRGIIKAATGSGKTAMAANIIANLSIAPFIFYVPSIDLLNQAKNEIAKFIIENNSSLEVGIIGGGYCDIKDINVMTIQTAVRAVGAKYKKFDDEDSKEKDLNIEQKKDIKKLIMSAKGIIGDETQHWASETCQVISDYSVSAYYKYGISATPMRDKGDDLLIEACFGKTIADISASFLIEKGFLVKPHIYFVPVKHSRYNVKTYAKIYQKAIVENTIRNEYIAQIAIHLAEKGKIILILCRHIAHGKILNEMISGSVFLHGVHSGKARKEHLDKMRDKEVQVTISTAIFDEGIDCRSLDALILAGSGKSQTRALQRIGRTLRTCLNKDSATVVDFDDDCKYLSIHSKKRKKIYRTEPAFEIEMLDEIQS